MEKNSSTSSFKDVRRFLMRIALPVLGFVVIFMWVFDGFFFRQVILGGTTSGGAKIELIYEENGPDRIPIIGSSRAAGSYIPSEIHPDAWNYGIEKTQFKMMEIFLSEEFKKARKTPVILNFDYRLFEDWQCNPAYLVPHSHREKIRAYMGEDYSWTHRIPSIRYFGHFDNYIKNNLAVRSGKNLIDGGGFFLRDPFNPKEFASQVKQRMKKTQKFTYRRDWDERLFKLLRSRPDRQVYFVVAPYHASYFHQFPNLPEGKAYLNKLAALPNVQVLDFGEVDYPDELFKNTSHLNLKGARRFSQELKAAIGW